MNFNLTEEELRIIDAVESSDELDVLSLTDIETDHIFDVVKGSFNEL